MSQRARIAVAAGALAATVVALVVLVVLSASGGDEVDRKALEHARAACELTGKAGEAAEVDTAARYAAAAFLLDSAILESQRAALGAVEFTALDQAVQDVHIAAHEADRDAWRLALDVALEACSDSTG